MLPSSNLMLSATSAQKEGMKVKQENILVWNKQAIVSGEGSCWPIYMWTLKRS